VVIAVAALVSVVAALVSVVAALVSAVAVLVSAVAALRDYSKVIGRARTAWATTRAAEPFLPDLRDMRSPAVPPQRVSAFCGCAPRARENLSLKFYRPLSRSAAT